MGIWNHIESEGMRNIKYKEIINNFLNISYSYCSIKWLLRWQYRIYWIKVNIDWSKAEINICPLEGK